MLIFGKGVKKSPSIRLTMSNILSQTNQY